MSETAKYRHLTTRYCYGNGLDIGAQGDPVVPWAIQVELPEEDYKIYTSGTGKHIENGWRGDGRVLPFKDKVCDFVYSSHLLEDFADWEPSLREWLRVLKPNGHLIILMPDGDLWDAAVRAGQPQNDAHRRCGRVGDLTAAVEQIANVNVIEDRLTNLFPGDYSILFVAQKI